MSDFARRRFLRGLSPNGPGPVRPPWALAEAAFTAACSRCQACVAACPENIIVRRNGGYPEVDFTRGECTFCEACKEACPEPAFSSDGASWSLAVSISDACLAAAQVVCQSCRDACPERAIRFPPRVGAVATPVVDSASCSGCGACVTACPADAIQVTPDNGPGAVSGRVSRHG